MLDDDVVYLVYVVKFRPLKKNDPCKFTWPKWKKSILVEEGLSDEK